MFTFMNTQIAQPHFIFALSHTYTMSTFSPSTHRVLCSFNILASSHSLVSQLPEWGSYNDRDMSSKGKENTHISTSKHKNKPATVWTTLSTVQDKLKLEVSVGNWDHNHCPWFQIGSFFSVLNCDIEQTDEIQPIESSIWTITTQD